MPPVASPTEAPSCLAVMRRALQPRRRTLILYSIDLRSMRGSHPFGRETFARREDAERFIEELRREEPRAWEFTGDRGARARGRRGQLADTIVVSADARGSRTLQH